MLAGCSTTKHLPEGEILYTGQKKMIVENRSTTPVGETAMEEVEAALIISVIHISPFIILLYRYTIANSYLYS